MNKDGIIHILPPEEARKIAAGEVIDRPAALVREFMDNAIDSGAQTIDVAIQGGGIVCVEVNDDGGGMDRADLELCCLTHATSKIQSLADLERALTLGFRGEALAAAAAVSRVEILTSRDSRDAWKLETGTGTADKPAVYKASRTRGTSVRSMGLFDAIPARKRFLKRPGSEAAACHTVFCDKAMAFPEICFRFTQDAALKTFLPLALSRKERFAAITGAEKRFLHEITAQGRGFRVIIVFGGPELPKKDRRHQYIFANGRRIDDYALNQALEYGLRGVFPNGTHPAGAVFIEVDPALADFNVHPAKREVRFVDPAGIHHAITGALENYWRMTYPALLREESRAAPNQAEDATLFESPAGQDYVARRPPQPEDSLTPARLFAAFAAAEEAAPGYDVGALAPTKSIPLIKRPEGTHDADALASTKSIPLGKRPNGAYDVGALAPLESIPLIKRPEGTHDADARLYSGGSRSINPSYQSQSEGLIASTKSIPIDTGLEVRRPEETSRATEPGTMPRVAGRVFGLFIIVERGDRLFIIDQHAAHERVLYDRFISGPVATQELLVPLPFTTESAGDDAFLAERQDELANLGIVLCRDQDGWRVEALPALWRLSDADTVRELLSLKTAGKNLAEHWAATLSCRSAVMDGDYLDDDAALALAKDALALPDPHCPHGRPIWVEISREALLGLVKRV